MTDAPAASPTALRPTTWAWLIALLGWTTLICFYDLSGGARFEMIDCWVAQTAREMQDADDWLVPRYAGGARMQKSPGAYWAVMLTSQLRGTPVDEVSARIPNALAGILLVMTVFWLTRHVAGDKPAIFAGFATASSTMLLWWSIHGMHSRASMEVTSIDCRLRPGGRGAADGLCFIPRSAGG